MYLYLITRNDDVDYDQYEGAVVAANNLNEVTALLPYYPDSWAGGSWDKDYVKHIDNPQISIELIGTAGSAITEPQLIIASFNAG